MNNSIRNQACEPAQIQQSGIEKLVEGLFEKTDHLSKSIEYSKETIRRLDNVANKLNPAAFYKNIPQPTDGVCHATSGCGVDSVQSGIILSLSRIIENIYNSINELDYFTNQEVNATVKFFEDQI